MIDFYCPKERPAIESDGYDHVLLSGGIRDSRRTRILRHFWIRVIRFENELVFKEIERVVDMIRSNFGWRERGETPTRWIPSRKQNDFTPLPSLFKVGWQPLRLTGR